MCPLCGAGPFLSVGSHIYGAHGRRADDVRRALRMTLAAWHELNQEGKRLWWSLPDKGTNK